jgi:hypothetical protein
MHWRGRAPRGSPRSKNKQGFTFPSISLGDLFALRRSSASHTHQLHARPIFFALSAFIQTPVLLEDPQCVDIHKKLKAKLMKK